VKLFETCASDRDSIVDAVHHLAGKFFSSFVVFNNNFFPTFSIFRRNKIFFEPSIEARKIQLADYNGLLSGHGIK
jgi:hypothetical protein